MLRRIAKLISTSAAVTSTKGAIGHTLGAAGAIKAAFTMLAVQTGTVPPKANSPARTLRSS